jgi:predicted RNA binding protein YcfA (HicA-like mRNA interferase family)
MCLLQAGFKLDRVKGSHHFFIKLNKEVIVPKHSGDVASFIIRNIKKAIKDTK